jgi:hypothetical protein
MAVAAAVETPSATIAPGLSCTAMLVARPTVWVSVARPNTEPSLAVIVDLPTVVDEVMVAVYLPFPMFWVLPTFSAGSLEENETVSAGRTFPWASVTVAVAVVVETPLAMIEAGVRVTATLAGGPAVWVSVWVVNRAPSLAVIVGLATVVDEVMVAV